MQLIVDLKYFTMLYEYIKNPHQSTSVSF